MVKLLNFVMNKLVRDKIPSIMQENNIAVNFKVLSREQYILELKNKLIEEAKEVLNASNKIEILEELSDIFEVMRSIMDGYKIQFDELIDCARKKGMAKGVFDEGVFISDILVPENHAKLDYYRSNYTQVEKKNS